MTRERQTVLFVSFFHPEIVRGGSQVVAHEMFLAAKRDPDLRPVLLAACDPGRHGSKLKVGAFVTGFDEREDEYLYFGYGFDAFYQRATNARALERLEEFLREIRPAIVHLHHTLLFGVNTLPLIRRVCPDARIVYTLHEFVPICVADGQMVRWSEGRGLCTHASPYRCHECLPERTPDEFWLRRRYLLEMFAHVDLFVAPSEFLRERYLAWGIAADRIVTIPNGQRRRPEAGATPGEEPRAKRNRFAYFGQLIDNKGPHVLLQAVLSLLERGVDDFSLVVHGANLDAASPAYREKIEALRDAIAARGFRGLTWSGRYDHARLGALMSSVDWVVVPSTWWENDPLVVAEAWMSGRPVIASDLGGLRERVAGSGGGLLFEPGDATALAGLVERCLASPDLWEQTRRSIRRPWSTDEAWAAHLEHLDRAGRPLA